MKHNIIMAATITLALASQTVTSGTITDTYTTGDTLTATTLDNIKTAVNDNNTRITTLEAAKTGSVTIAASAFLPESTTLTYNKNVSANYYTEITSGAGFFVYDLPVPAGTTITSLQAHIYDGNATAHITADIRYVVGFSTATILATAETTDAENTCSPCTKTSATISHVVSSTFPNRYLIRVYASAAGGGVLGFYAVQVNYTYTP